MEEQWKWIKGYEGLYQVSNYGRVKSYKFDKKNGRLLSPRVSKSVPYLIVSLRKDCKDRKVRIHTLVYETFVSEEKIKDYQIHHIDGNKLNNYVGNLAYIDVKEHMRITNIENPQIGEILGKATIEKCSKPVIQYSIDMLPIKKFQSVAAASRELQIDSSAIGKVARRAEYKRGKARKQAGGYVWRYEEDVKSEIISS